LFNARETVAAVKFNSFARCCMVTLVINFGAIVYANRVIKKAVDLQCEENNNMMKAKFNAYQNFHILFHKLMLAAIKIVLNRIYLQH